MICSACTYFYWTPLVLACTRSLWQLYLCTFRIARNSGLQRSTAVEKDLVVLSHHPRVRQCAADPLMQNKQRFRTITSAGVNQFSHCYRTVTSCTLYIDFRYNDTGSLSCFSQNRALLYKQSWWSHQGLLLLESYSETLQTSSFVYTVVHSVRLVSDHSVVSELVNVRSNVPSSGIQWRSAVGHSWTR